MQNCTHRLSATNARNTTHYYSTAWIALSMLWLTACDTHSNLQTSDESAENRPNIIFLLADDQRADSLSVAGHAISKTPNIDRLAQTGTRYINAFTVEPICAPSRYALMSGQYERTSGLGFNSPYQVSENQWQQTYPALLRKAGYYTGFVGKFGVQYYDLNGGAAAQFDYWRAHDGWLPFFPKELPDNPATEIYQDAQNTITTEIMGEYITDFLQTRPTDAPFNLSVSFSAPHNSVVSSMIDNSKDPNCTSRACELMGHPANENPRLKNHPIYDQLYRNADIKISEDVGGDPYRFIPEGLLDHEKRKHWYAYNYDRSTEPEHLIRYYQTIAGIDRVVGELLTELERLGIADNTIIIYSSDHGLLNGEYGTGGKALLYDLVTHIPLIVYDPRNPSTSADAVNGDLVLSIDVPATILSIADIPTPDVFEGRSLINNNVPAREEVFLESLTVAEGNPFIEGLRTHEWKYMRYFKPADCPYVEEDLDFSDQQPVFEQLFHVTNDPQEKENLVDVAQHASVLAEMRAKTAAMSNDLTLRGRLYKKSFLVDSRPEEDVYCW